MTGMHSQKFKFACPHCGAAPRKPCVETRGPKKGKTCKAHSERWRKYKKATSPKIRVKAVWSSNYESNRSKH